MPLSMQASFVAGELSPRLHARTDLDQYLRGVALARNCFVEAFGGLSNRPGSRFLDYTFQDHAARLIPFRFDDEQQYALELTEQVMRWFLGAGQLVCQPSTATITALVGAGTGKWNDLSTGGASVASVTSGINLVGAVGGVAIAEQPVTNATAGVELVLMLFVGAAVDIQVGTSSGGTQLMASRTLAAGFHNIAVTPPGTSLYIRLSHAGTDARGAFSFSFANPASGVAVPMTMGHNYLGAELAGLTWTQKADILTLCHPAHPPYDLKRYGALSWSLEARSFAPTVRAPLASELGITLPNGGATTAPYYYKVTYTSDSGEESLPGPPLDINGPNPLTVAEPVWVTLDQPLPAGMRQANIYKYRGGVFGFMSALPAGQPNFHDDGTLLPRIDQPPPGDRNPFGGTDNYPAAVAYWEQRLAMAGANAAPDTVEMSRPGAFYNFGRSSPTRDDDAITFTPAGNLVRRIRHMIGARALYLFTDSAVLAARRGDTGVTPAMEGGVGVELAKGATAVPPVQAGESVLFVTSAGRALFSIADRQSTEGYVGQELSLLSEHILNASPVVDMAWCEVPNSLLWQIRADGKMAVFAFLDRQQVYGWSLCDTAGRYEACCSARDGGIDYLYTVVQRRLDGQWRRCVERSAQRHATVIKDAFFVDCGLSYDVPMAITAVDLGSPVVLTVPGHTIAEGDFLDVDDSGVPLLDGKRFQAAAVAGADITLGDQFTGEAISGAGDTWLKGGVIREAKLTITGLGHLEGMTVAILADGSEHPQRVVTGGAITLQKRASRVHVGLPYVSDIETLNIAEQPDGYGTRKRVVQVQAYYHETRGVMVGPTFGELTEAKWRSTEAWGEPTRTRTGLAEIGITATWGLGGKVCFRQTAPLPFTLLAVLPVFERGSG